MSIDPHNDLNPHMDHYVGIDVGTGSARACIINSKGDIVGVASENIGLWQPEQGFYVRPLTFNNTSPPACPPASTDKMGQELTSYRNNQPMISGAAFAPPYSVF